MKTCCVLLTLSLILVTVSLGNAAVVVNIYPNGKDIVVTGSGSINTTGLTLQTSQLIMPTQLFPSGGRIVNSDLKFWDMFDGVNGQSSYGTRDTIVIGTGSGSVFYIDSSSVGLAHGYTSGSPISFTQTYSNQTLSSMGLTAGTRCTYSLPNDTVQVNILLPPPSTPVGGFGMAVITSIAVTGYGFLRSRNSRMRA